MLPSYRSWITPDTVRALTEAAVSAEAESIWFPDRISFPQDAGDRAMARPLGSWLRDAGTESTPAIDGSHQADSGVGDCFHDPLSLAGFVAALAPGVALGTGITILPLRDPIITARAVATLDRLTGGRFQLGVGAGHVPGEYDALGIDYATRLDRFSECVAAMQELWANDVAAFAGEHISFSEQRLMIESTRRPGPRVVIGGHGKRALRLAAERGDGWIASYLEPSEIRTGLEFIRDQAPDDARMQEFEVSVLVKARLLESDRSASGRPTRSDSGRLSLDIADLRRLAEEYDDAGCHRIILQLPTRSSEVVSSQFAILEQLWN